MTQEATCFFPGDFVFPKRLRIENNLLVSVNSGPFDEQFSYKFLTIEEAFNFIEDRLLQKPASATNFMMLSMVFLLLFILIWTQGLQMMKLGLAFQIFI